MYPSEHSKSTDMTGMVAIVTGGAGGIGEETCRVLAQNGASIAIIDYNPADTMLAELREMGTKCMALRLDVRSKTEVVGAVESILHEFGQIDCIAGLAGVCPRTRFLNVTEEEWDETFDINMKGVFFLTQAVFPHMMERKTGSIVLASSIAGRAYGLIGGPHYAASKAALQAFARYLARVGGEYGIRVNCVLPGPTETSMIADLPNGPLDPKMFLLGRTGQPIDTAQAILYLASPASNWVTGVWLDVNGGLLMA